jgi:DnaJ-class molecular chaperone
MLKKIWHFIQFIFHVQHMCWQCGGERRLSRGYGDTSNCDVCLGWGTVYEDQNGASYPIHPFVNKDEWEDF